MSMDAIFYPPHEATKCDGILRTYLDVGKYEICIEFRDLEDDHGDTEKLEDAARESGVSIEGDIAGLFGPRFRFKSQGVIFILDKIEDSLELEKKLHQAESANDVCEMANARESMPDLFQMDCFDTSEGVPATCENLFRAMNWCKRNQNYMKGEGV